MDRNEFTEMLLQRTKGLAIETIAMVSLFPNKTEFNVI
jgi:hypothetical protein